MKACMSCMYITNYMHVCMYVCIYIYIYICIYITMGGSGISLCVCGSCVAVLIRTP